MSLFPPGNFTAKTTPQYVVVRSGQSGVWLGIPVSQEGNSIVLQDARKAWNWVGAAATSGLANQGPTGGKICAPVSLVQVFDVCEIIAATPEAVAAWKAVPSWTK